jgi:hypothetical protein
MDALQWAQLSGLFAGMADSQATFNPAQKALTSYLRGSSESAIMAEAQKKAAKKAKKKDTIGQILGVASMIPGPQQPFVMGANAAYSGYKAVSGQGDLGENIGNMANSAAGAYGGYKGNSMSDSALRAANEQYAQYQGAPAMSPYAPEAKYRRNGAAGRPQMDYIPSIDDPSSVMMNTQPAASSGTDQEAPPAFRNFIPLIDNTSPPASRNFIPLIDRVSSQGNAYSNIVSSPAGLAPRTSAASNGNPQDALMGGAANRAAIAGIGRMSPRELNRWAQTTPGASLYLAQAQNAGYLTPKQSKSLSPGIKYQMRQSGYPTPGPLGLYTWGG